MNLIRNGLIISTIALISACSSSNNRDRDTGGDTPPPTVDPDPTWSNMSNADLPRTGTATFSGAMNADLHAGDGTAARAFTSSAMVQADFAENDIAGLMRSIEYDGIALSASGSALGFTNVVALTGEIDTATGRADFAATGDTALTGEDADGADVRFVLTNEVEGATFQTTGTAPERLAGTALIGMNETEATLTGDPATFADIETRGGQSSFELMRTQD